MSLRIWCRTALVIGATLAGAAPLRAAPHEPADRSPLPASRPTTQPADVKVDPSVQALIDDLSDATPAKREAATAALLKMGKNVVPALKGSADTDDPEVRARVRTLIRKLERRIPPSAPPARPGFQTQSMRASVSNGRKTIDVNDNGHKIHIEQKGDAIKMTVAGVDEDGQEASETYEAKSPDELKDQAPEAYALYEQWGGGPGSGIVIHGNGGQIRLQAGELRIGGNVGAGGANNAPATQPAAGGAGAAAGAAAGGAQGAEAEAIRMREMMRRQILQGNLPADAQERMLRQLDDVERMQRETAERLRHMRELNDEEHGPKVEKPAPPPAPPEQERGGPPVEHKE